MLILQVWMIDFIQLKMKKNFRIIPRLDVKGSKLVKGIKFEARLFNNSNLNEIKIHQNIILENLDENVNEEIIFTLLNIVEQDNKYLIVTSIDSIVSVNFR